MDEVIANFEGIRTKVYEDTRGIKTVGVGFNMEQPNARRTFQNYLPEVAFDDVLSGKRSLTRKEALSLFKSTLEDKIETTRSLIPSYDDHPRKVQTALVNAVFRGELQASHKTVKLMNKGEWDKVADEYLDRRDYREASKPDSPCRGIKTRMDYNANIFRQYARQLKK